MCVCVYVCIYVYVYVCMYLCMCVCVCVQGKHNKAAKLLEKGLLLRRQLYGNKSPQMFGAAEQLALLFNSLAMSALYTGLCVCVCMCMCMYVCITHSHTHTYTRAHTYIYIS